MLNMKSAFILLVLLVNVIYCEKESKLVTDLTISVNDHTETIEVTTLDGLTTSTKNTTDIPTEPTIPTTKSTTPLTTPTTPLTTPTTSVITSKTTASTSLPPTPPPSSTTIKPNTTSRIPITPTTEAPAPHKDRHFDGASFIGGIILAVGLMGIGFIAFKFYKARTERNYHTL